MTTTLLAVDDSKTMRRVLEITFAGEDYKVILAENGAQALEKIRSARPAVALVDANLGSESGYELCQKIKREAPGVGVLILSSKQQPYDKARGASAHADDFMDKPFDTQQLIDKTAALVRRMGEAPAAAAGRPAAAPAPAPSPRAPAVSHGIQPRAAAPAMSPPQPVRGHIQTLVGSAPTPAARAAPAPPAPARPAPAPAAPHPPPPAPTPAAAPVAAAMASAGNGQFGERLAGLGLSREQVEGVLALSREIVEQVVWEVVPQLAETLIREEIRRLTND